MDLKQITQFLHDNGPLIGALLAFATAALGLVRSELLALNPNVPHNGILQGRLVKAGLAVVPIIVADLAKGADLTQTFSDMTAVIPNDQTQEAGQ